MKTLWSDILTGPNNLTVAVGRFLGLLLFINLLLLVPGILVGVAILQKVAFKDFVAALPMLSAYVLAIGATVTGIIAGTAFTEPKP